MIIDFHTHVFPDKIAEKALGNLREVSKSDTYTDGTLSDLLRSMREAGVDYSVNLPVVTRPDQFASINAYASKISGRNGIISFGGIHPESPELWEQMEELSAKGVPGIKLHPDYQKVFIDDDAYVELIRQALSRNLYILIHSGVDIGYPEPVHCTPKRAANMLKKAGVRPGDEPRIILAHTGGYRMWEDVERYLVGKNVYFDTAFSLGRIPDDQFIRIVRRHGPERVLFATDSPWDSQAEDVAYLKSMDLTPEEKDCVFYKNAARVLSIPVSASCKKN